MYIDRLLQNKEPLSKLKAEIDALTKEIEKYNIIKSIPGIGKKIAANNSVFHFYLFTLR
jgi:transposase